MEQPSFKERMEKIVPWYKVRLTKVPDNRWTRKEYEWTSKESRWKTPTFEIDKV